MSRPGSMGFVRQALTEHLGLKLVALVASLGLFIILRGTEDSRVTVSVPLVRPENAGRMLVSEIPDEVRVTLRGSRSVLNAVRRDGIPAIRIPTDHTGPFYYIEQDEFEVPVGASVDQITPGTIQLTWADRADARLRIDPVIEGQVRGGFVLVATVVEPTHAHIVGAASEVSRLDRIRTHPIDVSQLGAGRHPLRIPLMTLPGHVSYEGPSDVVVTVVVEEQEGRRSLTDVEIVVVGATEVRLRPSVVNIRVTGPRGRVEDLHPRRVIPYVDVSGFDANLGAQPVAVQLRPLPEGLQATAEPAEVLVVPGG